MSCGKLVSVATLILDTHRLIESLKQRGFSENQAEGITDAIQQIDLSQISSKADIAELKTEMQAVEAKMLRWIVPLLLGQTALFAAIVGWLVV